jgi:hypothetical protein
MKTFNPIKLVKNWLATRKYKKEMKKKLQEMKDKDPYIYD